MNFFNALIGLMAGSVISQHGFYVRSYGVVRCTGHQNSDLYLYHQKL